MSVARYSVSYDDKFWTVMDRQFVPPFEHSRFLIRSQADKMVADLNAQWHKSPVQSPPLPERYGVEKYGTMWAVMDYRSSQHGISVIAQHRRESEAIESAARWNAHHNDRDNKQAESIQEIDHSRTLF